MKTSEFGRRFIEHFEGLYLKTYDDGTGTLTIGYGHTTAAGPPKVSRGQTITPEDADRILSSDLSQVESDVNRLVKVPLKQNQFDALVSFHFNTGGLGRSTLLKKLNAGAYSSVPSELMKWNRGGGRVMRGLTIRREEEGKLFNKASTSTPNINKIPPVVVEKPAGELKTHWLIRLLKFIFIK